MKVPNIISGYNEETKQFTYILEGNTCNYNLSRLLAMPAVSDIFSSFQYRKDVVFCNGVIQKGFQKMINMIPEDIILKFLHTMDSKANIDNIEDRSNLEYCSLSMYIDDDVAHQNIPAIFFDFNKHTPGCRKAGKIIILGEFIITVLIYPGVVDIDHPENNRIYTDYTIYDRKDISKFIYSLTGVNYDTKFFMVDNFPAYPHIREVIKKTINLDPNHVIHHHSIVYANTYDERAFVQAIDIVHDMDDMGGIHILDNYFEPSITKILLAIGEDIPENFERLKSIVTYNELENSSVYDLFGNHATFKQFKDSISIRRD